MAPPLGAVHLVLLTGFLADLVLAPSGRLTQGPACLVFSARPTTHNSTWLLYTVLGIELRSCKLTLPAEPSPAH